MITEKEYISRIKAEDVLASFVSLFTYTHQEDYEQIDEEQKDYLLRVHRMRIDALIKNDAEYSKYMELRNAFVDEYHNPKRVYWPWIFFFISIVSFFGLMFYIRLYC